MPAALQTCAAWGWRSCARGAERCIPLPLMEAMRGPQERDLVRLEQEYQEDSAGFSCRVGWLLPKRGAQASAEGASMLEIGKNSPER
jgi:hypothetical protein